MNRRTNAAKTHPANTTLLASYQGDTGRQQALAEAKRQREARAGEGLIKVYKTGDRYEVRLWNL